MKKASGIIFLILSCLLLTGCFDIRTNSLGTMLQNLSRSYPAIFQFLAAFSYVSGIWLLFTSLYKFKRYADTRGNMMAYQLHIGQPLIYFIVGMVLFYLPSIVSLSVFSLWGTTSVKSYATSSSVWAPLINGVVGLVRIVGYISFIRGWLIMVRMGSEGGHQPGNFGKALLHIVGGLFAINIVGTMDLIKNTLD